MYDIAVLDDDQLWRLVQYAIMRGDGIGNFPIIEHAHVKKIYLLRIKIGFLLETFEGHLTDRATGGMLKDHHQLVL